MVIKKPDMSANKLNIIAAIVITAFVGQLVVFGAVKSKVDNTSDLVHEINKNYVPMILMEGLIKNQNYQTEELVNTIIGDKERVHAVNEKYLEFQRTQINLIQSIRGGYTGITRGAKPETPK